MVGRRDVLRTGVAALAAGLPGCLGMASEPPAGDASVRWDRRFTDRTVTQFRRVLSATDGGFFALGSTAATRSRARGYSGDSDGRYLLAGDDGDAARLLRFEAPSESNVSLRVRSV